jgi:hypothetical protein
MKSYQAMEEFHGKRIGAMPTGLSDIGDYFWARCQPERLEQTSPGQRLGTKSPRFFRPERAKQRFNPTINI